MLVKSDNYWHQILSARIHMHVHTQQVFSITQGQSFRPLLLLKGHEHPITSIGSAYQSRRGIWAEDLGCQLVSCDDSGVLYVWQVR